jgi:hypothetical protein
MGGFNMKTLVCNECGRSAASSKDFGQPCDTIYLDGCCGVFCWKSTIGAVARMKTIMALLSLALASTAFAQTHTLKGNNVEDIDSWVAST